jgi:hypothetical protein
MMVAVPYKSFDDLVPLNHCTLPDWIHFSNHPSACNVVARNSLSESMIASAGQSHESFLGFLHTLECMPQESIPNSLALMLADHLFHAFLEDWFGLRERITFVLCVLCQRFPQFVKALVGRGAVTELAGSLHSESPIVLVNILKVISLCHSNFIEENGVDRDVFWSIARVFDEHLDCVDDISIVLCCSELFSRCFDSFNTFPFLLLPEIAARYAIAFDKRVIPLYPHIGQFADGLVHTHPQSDLGLSLLLDAGFLRVFDAFLDNSSDISLLPTFLSLFSCTTPAAKLHISDTLAHFPDLATTFVALFLDRRLSSFVLAQAIDCYRSVGLLTPTAFRLLEGSDVLSALCNYVRESDFGLRFAAGRCVCAAIANAEHRIARHFFSSPTKPMVEAMSLFEHDSPTLLVEMLRAMAAALETANSYGLLEYQFFDEFEGLFAKVVQRMLTSDAGGVREAALAVASAFFPELKYAPRD